MINKDAVDNLMKQCQAGFSGPLALDHAHGCLAECYGVLGVLLGEREELLAKIPKDRTPKQSASRWLYLEALAKSLNDAGIDRVKLLETLHKTPQVDVPNDKESLYLEYWRPIQKSMYPDAKRPNTKQISMIYETMNRHTIKTFSIGIPWPDKFGQAFSGGLSLRGLCSGNWNSPMQPMSYGNQFGIDKWIDVTDEFWADYMERGVCAIHGNFAHNWTTVNSARKCNYCGKEEIKRTEMVEREYWDDVLAKVKEEA